MAKGVDTQLDGNPMHAIAEVERETGIPRATIRIWERRYGFPAPARDARGERCYSTEEVDLLRRMRLLLDRGHRPAALIASGPAQIRQLSDDAEAALRTPVPRAGARLLKLLREHDAAAVRAELESFAERNGLERFAGVDVPALNAVVGEAWAAGQLEVHEEHLYSDAVDGVLRTAIAARAAHIRPEAPRVVLTTFPQEPHGLGLRIAEALFTMQGCPTISLGLRTPVEQIAAAARGHRADLVGLSFSSVMNPSHVLRGLEELRGLLPPTVRIWAGGRHPALARRRIAGVRAVEDASHIPALLAEDFALPPA